MDLSDEYNPNSAVSRLRAEVASLRRWDEKMPCGHSRRDLTYSDACTICVLHDEIADKASELERHRDVVAKLVGALEGFIKDHEWEPFWTPCDCDTCLRAKAALAEARDLETK